MNTRPQEAARMSGVQKSGLFLPVQGLLVVQRCPRRSVQGQLDFQRCPKQSVQSQLVVQRVPKLSVQGQLDIHGCPKLSVQCHQAFKGAQNRSSSASWTVSSVPRCRSMANLTLMQLNNKTLTVTRRDKTSANATECRCS